MKINKNSWHFKLLTLLDSNIPLPKSICGYFWTFMFMNMLHLFIAMCAGLLLTILSYPIWQIFFGTDLSLSIISFAVWIIVGYITLKEYRAHLRSEGKLTKKEPGILSMYIDAKHRKICPLVEYTNGS